MNSYARQIFLILTASLTVTTVFGQTTNCDEKDRGFTKFYNKMFSFRGQDYDSLEHYSKNFSSRLINYIKDNSSTLDCKFKSFQDSVGSIVTSPDGLFRIYSWDTWLGGTMHRYKNLFQFKYIDKVYTVDRDSNHVAEDAGTNFTDMFSLKTNGKTYYLAIGGGSLSSKDGYEFIQIYSISGRSLNDSVPLIKTSSGFTSHIDFEYDFFSVLDRPERPIRLIKYDADKKIIYIPIVLEDGKVTDRFILYQFTGNHFEKVLTKK